MKKWTPKQYAAALFDLLKEGDSKKVIHLFAKTLQKNGDVNKSGDIIRHFDAIWHDRHGKIKVEATVKDEKTLATFPKKINGRDVELSVRRDPTVLGGVRLKIGDFLIDGTLQSRINGLKRALANHE